MADISAAPAAIAAPDDTAAADPGDVITRAFQTNDLLALEKRTKMLKFLQGLVIEKLEIHHMHPDGGDAILSTHAIHDAYLESFEVTNVGGPTLGLAVTLVVKEPGVENEDAKFVRRVYDFHQLFPTGDWKTILDEDGASSVASGSTDYYSTSVEGEEVGGEEAVVVGEGAGGNEEDEALGGEQTKKKRHKKTKNDIVEKRQDVDEEDLIPDSSFEEPEGSSEESKSDDSLQRIYDARNQLEQKKKDQKKKNRRRGK